MIFIILHSLKRSEAVGAGERLNSVGDSRRSLCILFAYTKGTPVPNCNPMFLNAF
jgi:hypothetical protein